MWKLNHTDVAKVDRGMLHLLHMLQSFKSHVAVVCFECFRYFSGNVSFVFSECMLQLCLFDIADVLHICLHVFYSNVAYGSNGFSSVFQVCFLSVS
jgi:hypothetical protein